MLYSLGQDLLRKHTVADDTATEFQRFDGDQHSHVICCLPWKMPYKLAHVSRIVPRNYLACYEMPRAIVSSEPELCVQAVHAVVEDATRVFMRARRPAREILVVGLSIGNAVATAFANKIGARLCSIASADRGDLTLWESPASRHVREMAEAKGYCLSDFTEALQGLHTVENLENLAPGTNFVFGSKDELIPLERREGLISAVRRHLPASDISHLDAGHFAVMSETVRKGFCEKSSAREQLASA